MGIDSKNCIAGLSHPSGLCTRLLQRPEAQSSSFLKTPNGPLNYVRIGILTACCILQY